MVKPVAGFEPSTTGLLRESYNHSTTTTTSQKKKKIGDHMKGYKEKERHLTVEKKREKGAGEKRR